MSGKILEARRNKKNVPLYADNYVPINKEIHVEVGRGYVTEKQISKLAEINGMYGITFHDIMDSFRTEKNEAQRKLKYFRARKTLFTVGDLIEQGIELPPTFRNRIPQKYYASSIKSHIIEKMKKEYRNVLLKTTGTTQNNNPLFQSLEIQKANSYLDVLKLLPSSLVYIHKINLIFSIGKENYDEAREFGNKLGHIGERMGNYYIECMYHANGTVQISIESSRSPFKLETEEDVNTFFARIGQVRDRCIYHLNDLSERIIPPINSWILKQCDLNSDIRLTDKAQIYLPDIQLKTAGKVFRIYVKSLGEDAVCRFEESKETNLPLSSFGDIFQPNIKLENEIRALTQKIDEFQTILNSPKYRTISLMPTIF